MTLKNATKGIIEQPEFQLIHGPDGTGKSEYAAQAPDPIFLGSEDGTGHLDVTRVACPSYDDMITTIAELNEGKHAYKTVVVDSVDWLEPMIWDHVCKAGNKEHIEDFGYGKGYVHALDEWRKFIASLVELRHKGMNIILIAHSQIKRFDDPQHNEAYDRYVLKLNDKASAVLREAVDCVMFLNFETYLSKDDKTNKARAFGGDRRILYTERRPAFDAKNRFSLPFEIPLPKGESWQAYMQARARKPTSDPNKLVAECRGLLTNLRDAELKSDISKQLDQAIAGKDLAAVTRIKEKLTEVAQAAMN